MSTEDGSGWPADQDTRQRAALVQVAQALRELRFGTITIVIQDGVVVQIERTEKYRLPRGDK